MCNMVLKRKILGVLMENIASNKYPGLVDSTTIAEKLNLSEAETKRVIRSMSEMGVIESDEEIQHSLITREGILWFQGSLYPAPV